VHLKSGLIRGVVFLEGSSLVVFCYLIASEIWPDKRGDLSRGEQLKRWPNNEGTTVELLSKRSHSLIFFVANSKVQTILLGSNLYSNYLSQIKLKGYINGPNFYFVVSKETTYLNSR
jgi:hypothetical protein